MGDGKINTIGVPEPVFDQLASHTLFIHCFDSKQVCSFGVLYPYIPRVKQYPVW